jgi:hypothetical protein
MPRVADDSTSRGEQSHVGQVAVAHHVRGVALVTMRGEHDLSTNGTRASAPAGCGAPERRRRPLRMLVHRLHGHQRVHQDLGRASGEQIMLVPEYANLPLLRGYVSPSNRRIVSHGEG